jgi:transketolase
MKATRDGFGDQLVISGKDNPNIIGLSADLGKATKINKFGAAYPDRIFEMGIAENNMVGVASGMSEYGYKVFLASFASFLTGKYDTIRCSIAYSNAPCVIVGTHCGMAIGKDGVTQMGLEDLSLMRSLPGMTVLNPSTYNQTKAVVKYLCNNDLENPHYLRLGRQPVKELYYEDIKFELGKGIILKEGSNGVVFSTGCVSSDVLEATEGLDITVIDIPTIKPLDRETIKKYSWMATNIFTVEDHSIIGGLGSSVAEVIAEEGIHSKLHRIGLNDTFPESGAPSDLYEKYGLSASKIRKRISNELGK